MEFYRRQYGGMTDPITKSYFTFSELKVAYGSDETAFNKLNEYHTIVGSLWVEINKFINIIKDPRMSQLYHPRHNSLDINVILEGMPLEYTNDLVKYRGELVDNSEAMENSLNDTPGDTETIRGKQWFTELNIKVIDRFSKITMYIFMNVENYYDFVDIVSDMATNGLFNDNHSSIGSRSSSGSVLSQEPIVEDRDPHMTRVSSRSSSRPRSRSSSRSSSRPRSRSSSRGRGRGSRSSSRPRSRSSSRPRSSSRRGRPIASNTIQRLDFEGV